MCVCVCVYVCVCMCKFPTLHKKYRKIVHYFCILKIMSKKVISKVLVFVISYGNSESVYTHHLSAIR